MNGNSAEFRDIFFYRAPLGKGLEFGYCKAYRINGGEKLFKVFSKLFKVFSKLIESFEGDWLLSHSLLKVVKDPGLGDSFLYVEKGKNNPFVIIVIDLFVDKDMSPNRVQSA